MLASIRSTLFTSLIALTLLGTTSATPLEGLATRASRTPVYHTCQGKGKIALTFDDGPYKFENRIMDELDNVGAKASFFLNGQNFGCIYDYAEQLRRAFDDGHLLGSHTWSHADVTQLSRQDLNHELGRVETAFVKILGVKPKFFRPPYGNINLQAREVLAERGYRGVMLWDRDTKDADGATVSHSRSVMSRTSNSYPQSHMVLSHETVKTTSSQVVPHAIQQFKSQGYNFVTASECAALGSDKGDWYEFVQQPEDRNDSWRC